LERGVRRPREAVRESSELIMLISTSDEIREREQRRSERTREDSDKLEGPRMVTRQQICI
jgi:hypothetical protein